jgi:CheY-like chemotaxis protein
MNFEKPATLVVDDDPLAVATVGHELRGAGFNGLQAFDGPSAFAACMVHAPSPAVIDYRLAGSGRSRARSTES